MRLRHVVVITAVLLALAVIESSVLPVFLPNPGSRPNLVLVATSVWAALGAPYALVWAFVGGLFADLTSATPLGVYAFSLVLGTIVARLIEFAPIPVRWFRVTTWTAFATVVAHSVWLAYANGTGHSVDIVASATNVILPLLLLNPITALPAYVLLGRIKDLVFSES